MHSEPNVVTRRGDAAMIADVRAGLVDRAPGEQRELPPKYFYDHHGSRLFEAITRLPEYYLTRTERLLLSTRMPKWMARLRPGALVELGAGNADKTRTILDAMRAARPDVVYVPVDVSAAFLEETAASLRREYPDLTVEPVVADFANGLRLPRTLPRPILYAFLGSTIGNLEDAEATELLTRLRRGMALGDRLLLGADLVKDVAVIEAAYNDANGVTADFNRNMLRVLNHELGANFDSTAFAHRAFFSDRAGRIEMHLVAIEDQTVTIPGVGRLTVPAGDSIRTEISNKYTPRRLTRILAAAGLRAATWETDDAGGYALLLAAPSA
jgi:L-histidine Nalpha-methyltransferase